MLRSWSGPRFPAVSSRQYSMLIINIPARNFATNKLAHYLKPDSQAARAAGEPV
jgi:hypothetical protein